MTASFEDELNMSLSDDHAESLAGQTALITGASAGIGLATALRLLQEQVHVIAVARRAERLEALQTFVKTHPSRFRGQLTTMVADVRSQSFRDALAQIPAPDILIANAGLARGRVSVADSLAADMDEMISTNVTAVFQLIRELLPRMIARGKGSIIGLGSVAGHTSYENGAVYCATKHALRAFFESLRQETCHLPMRISLISPGLVETEFSLVRYRGDINQAKTVYQGLRSLGSHDIANLICYVLSRPPHVNVDNLIVTPQSQGSVFKIARNQEKI